jgi:hypothetical protein
MSLLAFSVDRGGRMKGNFEAEVVEARGNRGFEIFVTELQSSGPFLVYASGLGFGVSAGF